MSQSSLRSGRLLLLDRAVRSVLARSESKVVVRGAGVSDLTYLDGPADFFLYAWTVDRVRAEFRRLALEMALDEAAPGW